MSTKILYKYGAMNSGKSLELIKIAYNYQEQNIKTLILKPKIDTRKKGFVSSRTGLNIEAIEITEDNPKEVEEILKNNEFRVILVDECNFLTKEVIDTIIDYSYDNNIATVIFFGIKVDFRGNLFEGSKRIIERCDKIEETTSLCWCGKKARQNARVIDNKVIKDGPTILVDVKENNVEYLPLCNYHYYTNNTGK